MGALHVTSPGFCTSIQDHGRHGLQHLGVPESGALDPIALRLANALVGNAPDEGCAEALYVGPELLVEARSVRMAFVGADGIVETRSACEGEWRRATLGRSLTLERGASVRCRASKCASIYIAIEGGLEIAPVMGSVATDLRSRLGGLEGRALQSGDVLTLRKTAASRRAELANPRPLPVRERLRIMAGPQIDRFSSTEIDRFLASTFHITRDTSRVGMGLEGPRIAHARGFDIVSDAIAPGSIQINGQGSPIILLADRQTTGGYPKIGVIVSADLPMLGRLPIGHAIRFSLVSQHEALLARRQMFAEIDETIAGFDPVADNRRHETALHNANLISGFVSAAGYDSCHDASAPDA